MNGSNIRVVSKFFYSDDEVWVNLNFIGFSNYYITNYGRIFSSFNGSHYVSSPFKELKQYTSTRGYRQVYLVGDNRKRKTLLIHRLVGLAFIKNINNYPEINYKDQCPTNNYQNNLEWCTGYYNVHYKNTQEKIRKSKAEFLKTGIHKSYKPTGPIRRNKVVAVDFINKVIKQFGSQKECAIFYDVSVSKVSNVVNKKRYYTGCIVCFKSYADINLFDINNSICAYNRNNKASIQEVESIENFKLQ